ncbi:MULTISPECIES: trehalase family glycosidase [Francisella]|uniref:Alpha,alpha-trehalase n=1 Tax=Francisella opportunistica TaxID=2016517 RepID=A0A345JTP6_9GAMM|nr:trehalase family glycosidase [Francisella opportunistica]AXH30692.1 alpha,alpha-trehalase [Francisella opportunistica]AXH32332.1 alpha,alpha-trehalase [Francisella opportunistica]AXH33981.1 alpha,alpha-trehalase [Francisella opportunistica]
MSNNQKPLIQLSGELFEAVQLQPCFEDSKYFVDMTPKKCPNEILDNYKKIKKARNFNLKSFIEKNFDPPVLERTFDNTNKRYLQQHIKQMWRFLYQSSDKQNSLSSLIYLPKSYIVPGGRFREVYYWDCYFTCEGLQADSEIQIIQDIADNFAYLINKLGFVPNANRKYYLTRSQPPLFYLIVNILYKELGISAIKKYLPILEKEYSFWMNTKRNINGLNRYWDESDTPRPESYREDIEHAKDIENKSKFYRNIRAACESGWDFSSRWFAQKDDFSTIQTIDILPVDLNCYLYGLENSLGKWLTEISKQQKAEKYLTLAEHRKNLIQTKFWCYKKEFFYDINHITNKLSKTISLAGITPLFLNIATNQQAEKVAKLIKSDFLTEYGLITTLTNTAQQWDSPNGWAPLHFEAVIGLRNYGFDRLAKTIAKRFINTVNAKFKQTGKIREKYDVINPEKKAGGGEYIVQDGFGWTNGVIASFIKMYNL